jgi:hypothetical protein
MVRVWSMDTGRLLLVLDRNARASSQDRAVFGIDVSPDGSRIATAGADGSVRIFDAETGEQLVFVPRLHCVRRGSCAVNRAVFSPDGSRIATTGRDAKVRILDARTGRQLRVLHGSSRGGRHLSGRVEPERNATLRDAPAPGGTRIWDPRTGRRLVTLRTRGAVLAHYGHLEPRRKAGCSPCRGTAPTSRMRRAASCCVRWKRTRVYRSWPSAATVTPRDRNARRTDLRHRDLGVARGRRDFPAARRFPASRVQPRRKYVRVWALDPEHLLRIARDRVTRLLTEAECLRYLQRPCSDDG